MLIGFLCVIRGVQILGELREPRPVRCRSLRGGPRQRQQQVVVVGEHSGRARAGARPAPGRPRAARARSARPRRAGRRASSRWRPCSTSCSIRSRSASTAAGGGTAPWRSVATASGSSRSGSGVIDSHDARLTMRGRLTPTDHKVRIGEDMESSTTPGTHDHPTDGQRRIRRRCHCPPRTCRSRTQPRLYTDPEVAAAEQELIFERTWQLAGHVGVAARDPAATSPPPPAPSRCWSCATRTGSCGAYPQRLPAPRLAPAQRRRASARGRSAAATTAGPTGSTAR